MMATISFKNCEKHTPSTFCIIQYLGSYRMMQQAWQEHGNSYANKQDSNVPTHKQGRPSVL
jgi:hypothetical protein